MAAEHLEDIDRVGDSRPVLFRQRIVFLRVDNTKSLHAELTATARCKLTLIISFKKLIALLPGDRHDCISAARISAHACVSAPARSTHVGTSQRHAYYQVCSTDIFLGLTRWEELLLDFTYVAHKGQCHDLCLGFFGLARGGCTPSGDLLIADLCGDLPRMRLLLVRGRLRCETEMVDGPSKPETKQRGKGDLFQEDRSHRSFSSNCRTTPLHERDL
eukprot:37710-Rhodomonas_salina.1